MTSRRPMLAGIGLAAVLVRPGAAQAANQPNAPRGAGVHERAEQREPREIVVRPALDAAITVGTGVPALLLELWIGRQLPRPTGLPLADGHVSRGDRVALGRFSPPAARASDAMLGMTIALPLLAHGLEAGLWARAQPQRRGRAFGIRYGEDLLLLTETLAINHLITQALKLAVQRPRPYAYLDPQHVDASLRDELVRKQQKADAMWSFPSGHASNAFAFATAGATLLTLRMRGQKRWPVALLWVGATGLATTTAALRVVAGRHFPSDVVTGALMGTAIGAAVPLAHWRPAQSRGRDKVARTWRVGPGPSWAGAGLSLSGALP